MTIQRLENVGLVFADLDAAVQWFVDLGMEVLERSTVEGEWSDRVVGLQGARTDIAMLQTPDGHGRLELMHFQHPAAHPGEEPAPANTLGTRRVAFSVDDLDAAVAGLRERGGELVGEVVQYQDAYRLCYARGPEGIIVMLAEELG